MIHSDPSPHDKELPLGTSYNNPPAACNPPGMLSRCNRQAVAYLSKRKQLLFLSLPLVVAVLMMVPVLASPHFGFLDDAFTLKSGRELTRSIHSLLGVFTAIGDTGRFIPFYWFYYALVYWVGWANPLFFFIANTLSLLVITGCIVVLVKFRGGSTLQASAAGILFVLSGPVLESFYTNSQEGAPQSVLLGISFLLLAAYSSAKTRPQRLLIGVGMFLAFLGANCSMETSVATAAVGLGWFFSARLRLPAEGDRMTEGSAKTMAVTSALAALTWYVLRSWILHVPLTGGSYTSGYKLELHRILDTGAAWFSYLFRDFPYLLPLTVPVLLLRLRAQQYQLRLILDSLIWTLAFTAIYLPWQSALEYYMLGCAIGCAIFGGIAVGQMIDALRHEGSRFLNAAAGIAAVLFLMTCVNNWTNGRYEMTMDSANMALIDYLGTLPPQSRVLVNIREPNEYEYEIGLHLVELKGRSDISVDYFRLQNASPEERAVTYYVATPVVKNELHPSVRYGLYGDGTTQWHHVLTDFMTSKPDLVYRVENQMRIADFGLQRLLCLVIGPKYGLYCDAARPFIDGRLLTYGWEVYRVTSRIEDVARPAEFLPDGTWLLQSESGDVRRLRLGEPGDYPIRGDWDGHHATGIGVFRPSNKTWYLDTDLDGKPEIVFQWDEMQPGDIPIVGDWDGKGRAGPGYFRPRDVSWHFLNAFREQKDELVFQFGTPGDIPLVGDWDGNGRDTIGIYRKETGEVVYQSVLSKKAVLFSYRATPGATPVVGSWGGHGKDSLAFVTKQSWNLRLVNCVGEAANPPRGFTFGQGAGWPLAGRWR